MTGQHPEEPEPEPDEEPVRDMPAKLEMEASATVTHLDGSTD